MMARFECLHSWVAAGIKVTFGTIYATNIIFTAFRRATVTSMPGR